MANLLLNCVPENFDIDRDGDGFCITVPALEGVDGFRYVTLDVRLDHYPSEFPDAFEFSFGFTIADLDDCDVSYFTQDRYQIEAYFEGHSREFVMPTVCACAVALVKAVGPNYIYRVTKGRELPHKALVKHFVVTDTLAELGYDIAQTGTDGMNRTFWLLSR